MRVRAYTLGKGIEMFGRRVQAAVLAGTLVLAACGGSSGDSGSTGTDAPPDSSSDSVADDPVETGGETTDTLAPIGTEPPVDSVADTEPDPEVELTASARGITPTEIHVGITTLDFDELKELNLSTEGWGDQEAVYQAFIDDLNERGGIAGRTVVPHYSPYSVLGATAAEAVCTELTKDIETFAVLGGFVGPAEEANRCIVELNDTFLIGGRQTTERLADAQAPWVDAPTLRERRLEGMLTVLDADGRLDGVSLAVIGSVEQQDVYDAASAVLEAAGVNVVLEALNDAPQGDVVASDARWDVLAENISVSGADTVLIIGSGQAALRGTVRNGLDIERWVLETTDLENLGADTLPEDAAGAITMSGLTDEQIYASPSTDGCKEIMDAAGIDGYDSRPPIEHVTGDEQWYRAVSVACRNVKLLELLVGAAGPNPTQETVQAAIDGYGELSLPGVPFASLGPDKPDLNDSFQLSEFDPTSGENGGLVPITDLIDGTP